MFRIANDEELGIIELGEYINKHMAEVTRRYRPLIDAYETKYPSPQSRNGSRTKESLSISLNT